MKNKIPTLIAAIALTITPAVVHAQLQINRIVLPRSIVSSDNRYLAATLEVPNRDTSLPAYGGRLTLRHAYLAKMYEATYYQCGATANRNWASIAWRLTSERGVFFLSCSDAARTVNRYGLMSNTEATTILYGRDAREIDLPSLDITGEQKVSQWIQEINRIRFEN